MLRESSRIKSFIEFVTVLMHRHLAKSRDAGTSNAKCRDTPLMKPLTRGGCPNGEPFGARSEFCRVPPNSSALLVTFRAPAKSYSPAGANTRHPHSTPEQRQQIKKQQNESKNHFLHLHPVQLLKEVVKWNSCKNTTS